MKKMTVGEFKANFSVVIEQVKSGEEIAVTYGKKKDVVGYFVPEIPKSKTTRKLGILDNRARVVFHPDFKITDEEFLG